MKKTLFSFAIISIFLAVLIGCSGDVNNSLTFQNTATNAIMVNFRAEVHTVASGAVVTLENIEPGTYLYVTTYELPSGATSSQTQGDVSGEVELFAGSETLILYSSALIDGVYIISASKTTTGSPDDRGNPLDP
jgi:hypothetical protein